MADFTGNPRAGSQEPLINLRLDTSEAQEQLAELQIQSETVTDGLFPTPPRVRPGSFRTTRRYDPVSGRFTGGRLAVAPGALRGDLATRAAVVAASASRNASLVAQDMLAARRVIPPLNQNEYVNDSLDRNKFIRPGRDTATGVLARRRRTAEQAAAQLSGTTNKVARRISTGMNMLRGGAVGALASRTVGLASKAVPVIGGIVAVDSILNYFQRGQNERLTAQIHGDSGLETGLQQISKSITKDGFGLRQLYEGFTSRVEAFADLIDEAIGFSSPEALLRKNIRKRIQQAKGETPEQVAAFEKRRQQQISAQADQIADVLSSAGRFESPNATRREAERLLTEKTSDRAIEERLFQEQLRRQNGMLSNSKALEAVGGLIGSEVPQ